MNEWFLILECEPLEVSRDELVQCECASLLPHDDDIVVVVGFADGVGVVEQLGRSAGRQKRLLLLGSVGCKREWVMPLD